ncbi:hypothetical protein GOV04_02240 [Candidatus Woesearchaeota archaeon]|nr:hypothetical protein [Candidatus Woesearchaeota archaeon]
MKKEVKQIKFTKVSLEEANRRLSESAQKMAEAREHSEKINRLTPEDLEKIYY